MKKADANALTRAIALGFLGGASPDFSPRYIGKRTNGERGNVDDGMVLRANGNYRLAEDVGTGSRILLRGSMYNDLVGVRGEDRDIWLKENPEGLSVVSGWSPGMTISNDDDTDMCRIKWSSPRKGRDFRHDTNAHEAKIQFNSRNRLNLYPSEITSLREQGGDENDYDQTTAEMSSLRTIIMPNEQFSYGFYEQKNGQWLSRRYIRTDGDEKKAGDSFVKTDPYNPDGRMDNAFSLGEKVGVYNSLAEAYAYGVVDWSKRAKRIRDGKSPLTLMEMMKSPVTTTKRNLVSAFNSYIKNREWKEILIHSLPTLAMLPVVKGRQALVFAKALVLSLAAMKGGKIAEDKSAKGMEKVRSVLDRLLMTKTKKQRKKKKNASKPYANVKKDYVIDPENSEDSTLSMLDPKESPFLRLLTQEEAGMNYDDGVTVDVSSNQWLEESILRSLNEDQPSHGFVINPAMMSFYHLDSGLVLLVHFNETVGKTTVYAAHRPEIAASDGNGLSKYAARLDKESIIKIERKVRIPENGKNKQEDFLSSVLNEKLIEDIKVKTGLIKQDEIDEGKKAHKTESLTKEHFEAEVLELLIAGDNKALVTPEEKKQTLKHIQWLFNTKAEGGGQDSSQPTAAYPWTEQDWPDASLGEEGSPDGEKEHVISEEERIANLTRHFEGMELPPLRPAAAEWTLKNG